ncbi:hypothetical protein GCM10011504_57970 [Siccirubricoccus deserti]|nr:hypothetical protein GCM10011504_57970 [Siccirubricoccus deserti]
MMIGVSPRWRRRRASESPAMPAPEMSTLTMPPRARGGLALQREDHPTAQPPRFGAVSFSG